MTHRERWIVYPLLFLAMGLAFKSSVLLDELQKHHLLQESVRRLEADVIQCNRLVTNYASVDRLEAKGIHAVAGVIDRVQSKALLVVGPDNQPRISMATTDNGQAAVQTIFASDGSPVVILAADPTTHAGLIETLRVDGIRQTALKSLKEGGMLTLFAPQAKKAVVVGPDGKMHSVPIVTEPEEPTEEVSDPKSQPVPPNLRPIDEKGMSSTSGQKDVSGENKSQQTEDVSAKQD